MEANKITGIGNNMKKNVAGQKVGSQMITAADGTVFTSTVTAYVTGDAGTQAIGTVGSGVCTHEGNGYHTYAPSQAETNYDLTAFTFIGTGAIATTLQAYNSFPQTVDNDVLAAGATGFAAIDTVVDSILLDTAEIGPAGAGLTNIGTIATVTTLTNLPTIPANWLTAAGTAADFTTEVQAGLATASAIAALNDIAATDIVSAGAITTLSGAVVNVDLVDVTTTNTDMRGTDSAATATALATVDTVVDGIQADLSNATDGLGAIKEETALILGDTGELQSDNVPGLIASLNDFNPTTDVVASVTLVATTTTNTDMVGTDGANTTTPPTAIANADALLTRDMSAVTGESARSPLNAFRFLRNKWGIVGTTLTVTEEDDVTAAWTATVSVDAGADPVTGSDPA
jgi:hypothetical protein